MTSDDVEELPSDAMSKGLRLPLGPTPRPWPHSLHAAVRETKLPQMRRSSRRRTHAMEAMAPRATGHAMFDQSKASVCTLAQMRRFRLRGTLSPIQACGPPAAGGVGAEGVR